MSSYKKICVIRTELYKRRKLKSFWALLSRKKKKKLFFKKMPHFVSGHKPHTIFGLSSLFSNSNASVVSKYIEDGH